MSLESGERRLQRKLRRLRILLGIYGSTIEESLNEKKEELEDLEALNQALFVKEQRTNVELTDAGKELIDGMKQYLTRAFIGVKRMGELDVKRFHEITNRKLLEKDADVKAAQLCSI